MRGATGANVDIIMNEILEEIFALIDLDGDEQINFYEFALGISVFFFINMTVDLNSVLGTEFKL